MTNDMQAAQEQIGALFAGKTLDEQKALLAALERGGAAIYRSMAEQEPDATKRDELLAAAVKEEENAHVLERQLSNA